jgi:hypothetical protein
MGLRMMMKGCCVNVFFYNTFYENIRRGWRTEGNWELTQERSFFAFFVTIK